MEEYSISQYQVDTANVAEISIKAGNYKTLPSYVVVLIDTINHIFGTLDFQSTISTRDGWTGKTSYKLNVVFVGESPEVEIASYAFEVLLRKLIAARKAFYNQIRRGRSERIAIANSYAEGWAHGVREKVSKLIPHKETKSAVREYFETDYKDLKEGKTRNSLDEKFMDAASIGYHEGTEVDIQSGVGENVQPGYLN